MADEQKIQDQSINKMTIPELRRAKSICEKKIEENEDKPSVVNKLKLMVSKFEKAERIINRYYEKTIKRNPSIVHASRNMLTLAKIGKQMKDSGFSGKASSVAAFLTNANMGKVTLGVGVAALGFGVANTIAHAVTANLASTSAFAGKGIMGVIFEALKLIPGLNPASIALLSVGAGLLIGRKLLPYIFRTAKKMSEHNTQIRKAENEIAEEQYNNSQGFDNSSLLADAFKKDRSKVVSVLFDHPDMLKEYKKLLADKNSDLNTTQRINLTEAIREAEGKLKDAKGKYKEAFAGSSKAGGSKKKALESRAEEFEAHPREGAPDGEEPKVEPVAPDGGEPAAPTGEEPAAPTGREPVAPDGGEPAAPTGEEPAAPTGEEPTAPTGGEPAAPTGEEPAAPTGEEPTAPTGEEPTAPDGGEPTAPTGEEPAAPTGEEPTAPTGEEPTAPDGGEPAAPTNPEVQRYKDRINSTIIYINKSNKNSPLGSKTAIMSLYSEIRKSGKSKGLSEEDIKELLNDINNAIELARAAEKEGKLIRQSNGRYGISVNDIEQITQQK